MAQWIKADGSRATVRPKGEFFLLDEITKFVGGLFEQSRCPCFTGDKRVMLVNDNGLSEGLQHNVAATQLYRLTHRGAESTDIVGDVLICETIESSHGEEYI